MRALALAALLLAGCASAPEPAGPTERAGLSARQLAPGECGLFVWRVDAAKTFTLFASARESVLWDGAERRAASSDPLATEQAIRAGDRDWRLSLGGERAFEGGTRYTSGTLRTSDDGWERVIPVVGLSTCAAEAGA